jgi:hypothetical protein
VCCKYAAKPRLLANNNNNNNNPDPACIAALSAYDIHVVEVGPDSKMSRVMAKKKQPRRAENVLQAFHFFTELPAEVQWQIAQRCEQQDGAIRSNTELLRVSRATRDLLIGRCSSISLRLNSDAQGDTARAAGCFLRRAGQHGRDSLKLVVTGLHDDSALATLLLPSLSVGGLSKIHDLELQVGKDSVSLQQCLQFT